MSISPGGPQLRALLKDPGHFLSLGCGTGLLRPAPGTWGSLLGVALALGLHALVPGYHWPAMAVLFLIGIPLCDRTARALGCEDPGVIVWDEVVGMGVALGPVVPGDSGIGHISPLSVLAAFALFRILDVAKPWPIAWCDRRLKGGLGVMADDLAAGLLAAAVLAGLPALQNG